MCKHNQKDLIPKREGHKQGMIYDPTAPLPGVDPHVHTQIHSRLCCSQQPKVEATSQSSANGQNSQLQQYNVLIWAD